MTNNLTAVKTSILGRLNLPELQSWNAFHFTGRQGNNFVEIKDPYNPEQWNSIIFTGTGPGRFCLIRYPQKGGNRDIVMFWNLVKDFHPEASGENDFNNIMQHFLAPKKKLALTQIHTLYPDFLAKQLSLDDNGKLKKVGVANLTCGFAERRYANGVDDLADIVTSLTSSSALVYGVCKKEWTPISTQKHNGRDVNSVSRTREFFDWPGGAGILIFDLDPLSHASEQTSEEIRTMILNVCPEFLDAPMMLRPSGGSCIYNSKECLIGCKGWRAWIPVLNAADIPRAGQSFFERSWLAGLGRIELSQSGSYLVRGPVDTTVWQPERLDFAGPAVCESPLKQRRPAPTLYNKDAEPFDTTLIKSLTATESAHLADLIATAKQKKRSESQAAKELWIEKRVTEAIKKEKTALTDERLTEIKNIFSSAVRQRTLYAEFVIHFIDNSTATVEQILDNKKKYHLHYCKDPVEPGLKGGKGRLYLLNTGTPYIWAYSHGGSRFIMARARKAIQIQAGERNRLADELLTTAKVDGTLYTRGGELVRVSDTGAILPVNLDALNFYLDGLVNFQKFNKKEQCWNPTDCSRDLATAVCVHAKQSGTLPELRTIVRHQILDPKTGRVIDRDGYDEGSGLLLWLNGETCIDIPKKPDHKHCNVAAQDIYRPFQFFPFAEPVDLGVFLAAILTAIIRPLLSTAPGFLLTAPAPGSGKTLLARCIAVLIGISRPAVMPGGSQKDDEEIRKKLFAVLREGAPVIIFDNLTGTFSSDTVCAALTSETFKDRILGVSATVDVSTATTIFLTGNNVTLAGDVCRRIFSSRIDAHEEKPWKRQFAFDPAAYCLEHRAEMIGAALTLLRGGLHADYQLTDGLGSFNEWNDIIRKTVCWIGEEGFLPVDDPVKSIDLAFEADPETGKLAALLTAWADTFTAPASVATAIAKGRSGSLFAALFEIGGEGHDNLNARRIGRWIEKHRGRIVAGKCFDLVSMTDGVKHWRVKKG